jgi:Sigma-70, region 4
LYRALSVSFGGINPQKLLTFIFPQFFLSSSSVGQWVFVIYPRPIDNLPNPHTLCPVKQPDPKALSVLDARERHIFEARRMTPRVTLAVLANEYGVSRERIRQLEQRAVAKIERATLPPIDWPAQIQAGLTQGERRVIEDAAAALERERGRLSWESWMRTGEALTIIRNAALKITDMKIPLGRKYSGVFGTSLRRFGIKIDPGVIARLFEVMRNRGAIEDWRTSLSSAERGRINHPQKVLAAWKKATLTARPQ